MLCCIMPIYIILCYIMESGRAKLSGYCQGSYTYRAGCRMRSALSNIIIVLVSVRRKVVT